MRPVFAHIKADADYFNLGDVASCPKSYFPGYADCPVVSLNEVAALPAGQPVILGGGGILAFPKYIARTAKQRPTIIWGAGLNNPLPFDPQPVVEALRLCALVGIRDRKFAGDFGFDYTPCASCMHPDFRDPRPYHDTPTVVYRHSWSEPFAEQFPERTNMDRGMSMGGTLGFIRSAQTVITNSYHGAYWAQLAGKRCIVWRSHEIRYFSGLPITPIFVSGEADLKVALDFSPFPTEGVLHRCISQTEQFRQCVSNFLATL